ncbi:uncharacterized protein KGF55_002826 [Candida pseudojiufengensis]|uniref:uncharacterized protein n=1 Tax=Candida pseudojiufengensis TaxID=497109 RepID=UPI0022245C7E|nr:uncharacterized protein KGF55_002826 [Candida pseudojiufengensis]KAI5963034.1 hypothetical protein KGF55_002826 [Candida pseudojiufengensis]
MTSCLKSNQQREGSNTELPNAEQIFDSEAAPKVDFAARVATTAVNEEGIVEEQASGAVNTIQEEVEEIANEIINFQEVVKEEVVAALDKYTEEFVSFAGTLKHSYKLKDMAGNTLKDNFHHDQLIFCFTFQDSPISTLSEFNKYLRKEEIKVFGKDDARRRGDLVAIKSIGFRISSF